MSAELILEVRSVTGRVRYYPIGDNGPHVIQLTGKKTLSEADVEALKALGVRIRFVKPS